jgi:tRNA-modifying protein YgfZ
MDLEPQRDAIANRALIRAMPELATIEVRDEERQSWLSGMVTCELKKLGPGQGTYGLHVSKNGRLQAELWIMLCEDRILIGVHRDVAEETCERMAEYLIMEDAEIAMSEVGYHWWMAHGPSAPDVAAVAAKAGASTAVGLLGPLPTAMMAVPASLTNPAECLTSVPGVMLATQAGWEQVRVQRHLPQWGVDFSAGCYPQEAALETLAVSFNKGCYIGQEAVFMLEKRGRASKKLVRLVAEPGSDVEPGQAVQDAHGSEVGKVTSVAKSATSVCATAQIKQPHYENGSTLLVGQTEVRVETPVPGAL